ncbi:MAG: hypothetical protein ACK41T_10300 [Pseudobdellovibrio sp.]
MIQQRSSCYCAFCKNTRKVYTSKHLNFAGIISLVVLSYIVSYLIWGGPDVRGLGILAILLVVTEGFTQLRWRQSMICLNCGFDPIVYLRDPQAAAQKIKDFMKYRAERPEYLLKPAVHMPVRREASATHANKSKPSQLSLRG